MARKLLVRDVMRRDVVTARPEQTVEELERLLDDTGLTGVPVVSGTEVVGVVSRADIHRALGSGEADGASDFYTEFLPVRLGASGASRSDERVRSLRVGDVMTPSILAVRPDHPVPEVARDLLERQAHRLLVTRGSRLLGLVTTLDLVRIAHGA